MIWFQLSTLLINEFLTLAAVGAMFSVLLLIFFTASTATAWTTILQRGQFGNAKETNFLFLTLAHAQPTPSALPALPLLWTYPPCHHFIKANLSLNLHYAIANATCKSNSKFFAQTYFRKNWNEYEEGFGEKEKGKEVEHSDGPNW